VEPECAETGNLVLDQVDHDQVVHRVRLPPGPEYTGPGDRARGAAGVYVAHEILRDREAQAEAGFLPQRHAEEVDLPLRLGESVGRHQADGLRLQEAHTIQRSFSQQHPREAMVVGSRRDEAPTAGCIGRRFVVQLELDLREPVGTFVISVEARDTAPLFARQPEVRVCHAEGREHLLLQDLPKRLSRDAAHQEAEDIRRMAVVESLARMVGERKRAERA
jgi:hypothetical protein